LLKVVLTLLAGTVKLDWIKAVVQLLSTHWHDDLWCSLDHHCHVLLFIIVVGNSHSLSIRRERDQGKQLPVALSVHKLILNWDIDARKEVQQPDFHWVSFRNVAVVFVIHLDARLSVEDNALGHQLEQLELHVELVACVQAHTSINRLDLELTLGEGRSFTSQDVEHRSRSFKRVKLLNQQIVLN
jgi:hypothetical protein